MDLTADATQPALQPDSQDALVKPRGARCRNCGSVETARYCANCGQTTALHPPTVREFIHEFVGHYIALEGLLWRTLGALLFTPGRLTTEYFAGRRARYVAPLRLYLTFSLVLFAFSGLAGGELKFGGESIRFAVPQDREALQGRLTIGPREKVDAPSGIAFIDRAQARVDAMTPAERATRINSGIRQYLPYVLVVLVPVLALYLKLLYWNRGRLYGEHLVVAFHAQTIAFVLALIAALPLSGWFLVVLLAILGLHGGIALRRVYGGRHWITALRVVLLFCVYGATMGLSVLALATVSLAFF